MASCCWPLVQGAHVPAAQGEVDVLTSSPRLKPGDSNPFMLREQLFGGGAVIPRGFLLVPASVSLQHPRVLQLLGRR